MHQVVDHVEDEQLPHGRFKIGSLLPAGEEQLLEVERVNRLELVPVVKLHAVEREERLVAARTAAAGGCLRR